MPNSRNNGKLFAHFVKVAQSVNTFDLVAEVLVHVKLSYVRYFRD